MRVHIRTTSNTSPVPFDYQARLVGALHGWIGENDYHDELSLYSLSWLSNGRVSAEGLTFTSGASLFLSTPNSDMVKKLIKGIQTNPSLAFGMKVTEVNLQPTPHFGSSEVFFAQSPILIKRMLEHEMKFYFSHDPESETCMTETLNRKLTRAGLGHLSASVRFDGKYRKGKKKVARYRNMVYKGTLCPVIVEGDPEAVRFAWDVGIGNLTGIGFGAIKERES